MKKLPSERSPTARVIRLPYPKDEAGKPLCRWCRSPVKPPRLSWCSNTCVEDYKDRYDNAHQRRQVKKRDRGVCSSCGLDTKAFREELRRTYFEANNGLLSSYAEHYIHVSILTKTPACMALLEKHGFTLKDVSFSGRGMQDFWQADHTVPVVEGGGGVPWQELRTLCFPCHRAETADLMARRRAAKKAAKSV